MLEPVPHRHLVLTMPRLLRGIFRKRGELLLDLAQCAAEAVAEYIERLLARLIERNAISEELARKLLAWRHPGFSAHVGDAIPFEDNKAIEDVACQRRQESALVKDARLPRRPEGRAIDPA